MITPDLIFSYWIFVWYILYLLRIVFINPKFALICGLTVNLIILIILFQTNTKPRIFFSFFVVLFVSKLIPLFTIWNTKIKRDDIYAMGCLFGIYLIWALVINNKKMIDFTNQIKDLTHNKNIYPGMNFINKFDT